MQTSYLNAMGIDTWQLKNKPVLQDNPAIDLMVVCDSLDGQARSLLTAMLDVLNLNPADIRIKKADSLLTEQIHSTNPKTILALGAESAEMLLNHSAEIEQLRGKKHHVNNIPVIFTYSLNYLLQNPAAKRKAFLDLQSV